MIRITKQEFKEMFKSKMYNTYRHSVKEATNEQIQIVLSYVIKDIISKYWVDNRLSTQKEIYYFSIEFLIGRQLKSNLLNLQIEDTIKDGLSDMGINIADIIGEEKDPALGSGGLGRLAACFLDSMASLGISGHGYGIRYKYGLFEQKFVNGYQVEVPDNWTTNEQYSFESVRPNKAVVVRFGGNVYLEKEDEKLKAKHTDFIPVMAVPYDIPIIGYCNDYINTLRLFKAEILNRDFGVRTSNAKTFTGSYEQALKYKYYTEEISQVLYPDDSNYAGKLLRLKQEYFLVSSGVQDIINKYRKNKLNIRELQNHVAIHINDTHPTLCIPELMRILLDEEQLEWDEAFNITQNTISYTNHTIMAEAMEKWPVDMMKELLPRIYMIIEEIDKRNKVQLHEKHNDNEKIKRMSIIQDNNINMSNLSVVGSYSVNGVAKLHTEILKKEVLNDFYSDDPDKFNNKTNGVAHRRWLISCNEELSSFLTKYIGSLWKKDPKRLEKLEYFRAKEEVLLQLEEIKRNNKIKLANFIKESKGIEVDIDSIFDVQIKRLHAYKRQLLNVLHILHLYHELLDNPQLDIVPRTFIFGAKAAPGYHLAKCIVKLINAVAEKINNDERIKNKIKVVYIENYGVSLAEKIIPATDVSEQISTTTKEASGTGNMKFMMNGAITLGTLDGANVEMHEILGDDNIVIFGLSASQVLDYNKYGGYSSLDLYNSNYKIKRVVDDLINGFVPNISKEGRTIYDSLITYNDEYFVLRDFENYIEAQSKIQDLYKDREKWNQICLINISKSGFFSSDRTISEYAKEIWFKGDETNGKYNKL